MTYTYKETEGQASVKVRCKKIDIYNPREGLKAAIFYPEKVATLPDGSVVTQGMEELREDYSGHETESFDLVDPSTGSVVGTATYNDLYAMLLSAYLHADKKKENLEAEEAAEEQRLMDELTAQETVE